MYVHLIINNIVYHTHCDRRWCLAANMTLFIIYFKMSALTLRLHICLFPKNPKPDKKIHKACVRGWGPAEEWMTQLYFTKSSKGFIKRTIASDEIVWLIFFRWNHVFSYLSSPASILADRGLISRRSTIKYTSECQYWLCNSNQMYVKMAISILASTNHQCSVAFSLIVSELNSNDSHFNATVW